MAVSFLQDDGSWSKDPPKDSGITKVYEEKSGKTRTYSSKKSNKKKNNNVHKAADVPGDPDTIRQIESGELKSKKGFYATADGVAASQKTAEIVNEQRRQRQQSRYREQRNRMISTAQNDMREAFLGNYRDRKRQQAMDSLREPPNPVKDSFGAAVYRQQERERKSQARLGRISDFAGVLTLGGGKEIKDRSFVGQTAQYTVSGLIGAPFYIGEGVASATEKAYLTGRGLVASPKNVKNEYARTLKSKEFRETFDVTSPKGLTTYLFAGSGAYLQAYAKTSAPVRTPKTATYRTSNSFNYKIIRRSPVHGRTGRIGGVKTKNILLRDTHLDITRNVRAGTKPVVSVARSKGVTQVSVGGKTYTQLSSPGSLMKAPKTTTIKSTQTGGRIRYTAKTARYTSFKIKPYPTRKGSIKLPKTTNSIEEFRYKTDASGNILGKGRGKQFRADQKMGITRSEQTISLFKKQKIVGSQSNRVSQNMDLKASLVRTSKGQNLRVYDRFSEAKATNIFKSKGKYPQLRLGKLTKPKDFVRTEVRQSRTLSGRPVENIMFFKQRGARLIRDNTLSFRDRGVFRVQTTSRLPDYVKSLTKTTKQPFINKKAQASGLKLISKRPTLNVGRGLTRSESYFSSGLGFKPPMNLSIQRPGMIPATFSGASPAIRNRTNLNNKQRISPTLRQDPSYKTKSDINSLQENIPILDPKTEIKNSLSLKQTTLLKSDTKTLTMPVPGSLTTKGGYNFNYNIRPPPPPGRPPILPYFRLKKSSLSGLKINRKTGKQPKIYTPSAYAIGFGIKGKPTEFGIKSGLGIRPIKIKGMI